NRVQQRDVAPVWRRASLEQFFYGCEPGDDACRDCAEKAVESERGDAGGVADEGEKNERYRQELTPRHACSFAAGPDVPSLDFPNYAHNTYIPRTCFLLA